MERLRLEGTLEFSQVPLLNQVAQNSIEMSFEDLKKKVFPCVQKDIPEYYPAFLALPNSRVLPYVTHSSRSLEHLKSTLPNSRLLPVHCLMVTSAFTHPNEPFLL